MPDPPPDDAFEQARARFLQGLACHRAGDDVQAEAHYLASLALLPGRASTLVNLAATQLRLGHPQRALASADAAIAAEPDGAEAWLHRATALAELGRTAEALTAFDRLLALAPAHAVAWSGRGNVLRELRRPAEAAQAFREALRHGADPALHAYYLASVEAAVDPPPAAPRDYVEPLFDAYADDFDGHLVGGLHYQAHQRLVDALVAVDRGPFASALDLGCGTGLCGPLVRPLAARLTGIDLSSRMLDKARALGVYDRLEQADVVEFVHRPAERHDLVLAADVFIYIGALEPLFAGVRRAMSRGLLCFSVERLDDAAGDWALQHTLRYAHSAAYLRRLATRHGFEVAALQPASIRDDQSDAVEGLLVVLRRGEP